MFNHETMNFKEDFVRPVVSGRSEVDAARIGLALDTAILFGAIQARSGHAELATLPLESLKALYQQKATRLKAGN